MGSTGFDALILGGGFSGLSCAAALSERGLRVLLIEKKPRLGGRAFSFPDPESGMPLDNGQHLFMGCYRQTRRFLGRIGAASLLRFQKALRVDYADAEGRRDVLACPSGLGSPWHLAWGVLRLKGLGLRDKWGLLRLDRYMRKLKRGGDIPAELDRATVRQWLDSLGQARRIQERLFDPIAQGALNEDPELAAATGLAQVMLGVFYQDAEGSRLGLSSVGLSDLYTGAARRFIESRGGEVRISAKAKGLREEGGRVRGAVLESGETLSAPCIVSTLPPWELGRLELPQALRGAWEGLGAAPIVSVGLWLERPVIEEPLVGMLGTDVQWVFNKSRILGREGGGQYLSLVISAARRHLSWEPQALVELAAADLARCFPEFSKAKIARSNVFKEPLATLSPVPGSDASRPAPGSGMPGFCFAGDWTRTGLPATIESAVAAGHAAAEAVCEKG